MPTPDLTPDFDLERDREWAQFGEELEWGTELLVEWGVRFTHPDRFRVSIFGQTDDDAAAAHRFIAEATPPHGVTVEVVARRVLYGPWSVRDAC